MLDDAKWKLALTHFDGFVSDLPISPAEDDVSQYHKIIDLFEDAGEANLSQFRMSAEGVHRVVESTNTIPGWQTRHPKESSVDPHYFRQQVRRLVEHLKASLDFVP